MILCMSNSDQSLKLSTLDILTFFSSIGSFDFGHFGQVGASFWFTFLSRLKSNGKKNKRNGPKFSEGKREDTGNWYAILSFSTTAHIIEALKYWKIFFFVLLFHSSTHSSIAPRIFLVSRGFHFLRERATNNWLKTIVQIQRFEKALFCYCLHTFICAHIPAYECHH